MASGSLKALRTTDTVSLTASSESGSSVAASISGQYRKFGNVVSLLLQVTPNSAMQPGASYRITGNLSGKIPEPTIVVSGAELNGVVGVIYPGGAFRIQNNGSSPRNAGSVFDVSFNYLTA